MDPTIQFLIERMVSLGMEVTTIPAYLRNVANTISQDPHMTLDEINQSMESLGWYDFHLDDHTLRLILSMLADSTTPLHGQFWHHSTRTAPGNSLGEDSSEHPHPL